MNARILALGAVVVLVASSVEAQARGKGLGRGRPNADSTVAKTGAAADHKDHHADMDKKKGAEGRSAMLMGRSNGMLFSGIQLTDAQKTRIKAIRESYRPRMEALRDSAQTARKDKIETADDTTFRTRTRALITSERAEIRTVLTAEQQVRYDANVQRMTQRQEKRMVRAKAGDRTGGPKP